MPKNRPMIFVNTRPIAYQAQAYLPLTQAIATIYPLPLLSICKIIVNDKSKAALDNLSKNTCQTLIVISPNAAKFALEYLANYPDKDRAKGKTDNLLNKLICANHQGRLQVVAVGKATAQMLRQAGFSVIIPSVASNEAMLLMPQIAKLNHQDKVMIWRGEGGRRVLAKTLMDKGVALTQIAWYSREPPCDLLDNLQRLQAYWHTLPILPKIAVLISSEQSFVNFCDGCTALGINWRAFFFVTLGDRLYNKVRSNAQAYRISNLDDNNYYKAMMYLDDNR